ncbi:hypothetical protein ASE69_07725 [Sphingomonas sp. Leaf208]|uniref:GmrSD restriction endonuclease domain-containing protein n=1 Tax=Sphingomonas sp. Leaf208 TaxID=1735679 RepID=UPI0006F84500|nr:DUF262 domain-containing protein [Sphingomonas sp. Leaf208]KQM51196.1 hypothetical protein ASE69_07725 [Sphingomonas sp. Leaf208]
MSIFQLINEIENGEIVLPAIQRDFVWDTGRIELLFDSLFRGYPVGIVLLWETYQPIQYRRFVKDFRHETVHNYDDNRKHSRLKLVLDGQQRLSSIFVALKGTFEGKKLYFDVLSGREKDDHSEEKYAFRFASAEEASEWNAKQVAKLGSDEDSLQTDKAYWLNFSDIITSAPRDLQRLRKTIKDQLKLTEDDESRVEQNLSNAQYTLSGNGELLKTQTIDSNLPANDEKRKSAFDILEIFVRINTQGMTLSRSDLIVSMLRLYWTEASTVLPHFIKEINDSSSLNIDTDFVIRCMFSTAGLGTRLDFELLRKRSNVDALKSCYLHCFEAIRSSIDFVRNDCGIDSPRLLGGISNIIPLVHFLYHAPDRALPKAGVKSARKSLLLFSFSRSFSQHTESRTRAFIRDHLPDEESIASGALFPYDEAIKFVAWKSGYYNADSRLFQNNIDLSLSIVQKRTGSKVFSANNNPEIDHIFPKSVLYERGFEQQDVDDIGNFWILPRLPNRKKSASDPKLYLSDVDDKTLNEALIDRSLLSYKSYKRFVRQRRENIVALLHERTGITDDDFSIVADDEEDTQE